MALLTQILSRHEKDTRMLAHRVASCCVPGDCVALKGDLGAGKTVFARGFIGALAAVGEVASPTFTLVQTYPLCNGAGDLWHFDLYRLRNVSDVAELGLDDALKEGISLIEWPELAMDSLPRWRLEAEFEYAGGQEERMIRLSGQEDYWLPRLRKAGVMA